MSFCRRPQEPRFVARLYEQNAPQEEILRRIGHATRWGPPGVGTAPRGGLLLEAIEVERQAAILSLSASPVGTLVGGPGVSN